MATEEKRMIHGVQVVFPCKPYPSQFSMMEKVIKGIERKQNCLLESPTGSGKSLALLCSALAWQTAEYEKKRVAEEASTASTSEESTNITCTCQKPKELNPDKNNDDVLSTQEVVQTAAQLISLGDNDDDDDFKDSSSSKFKTPGNTDKTKARRSHLNIAYETSPPGGEQESCADSKMCCACSCKQEEVTTKRKYIVPKIYFGTRTHKQITQIVRELRKTAYREAKMTILGSREHTCIHPSVSKMKGKNEGCKELLDGPGCKFNDRVKKVFFCQSQIKDLGLTQAWDLEDIIGVGQAKTACPYYGTRSLKKDADIIFSPYNYLIDPLIREALEINVKDQIIILDEAHNMEDAAREAASQTLKCDELEKAIKELDEMIANNMKTPDCLRIRQMCHGLIKFMEDNEASLQQQSYDQAYRCWSGYDIIARMDQLGIGPKHFPDIKKSYTKVKETEDETKVWNSHGQEVKLSKPVLSTLEAIHKVLDYLYRDDLKFVPDYRVAIVKTTSYTSNRDTDNSWLNSKKRRGMRAVPVSVNSLNFWCMNPGVAFSDFNDARSIVLTSGTLSPMSSFESELGAPFPIKLEANHVIEDKQIWVGAIGHGPKGGSLQAVYKTMETFNFQDELGELVLKVCQKVPYGVLVFLPSYKALEKFSERWRNTGVWAKIESKKKIMTEPRSSDKVDFEFLMKDFYNTIECCQDENEGDIDGALFIAVCRGKVSEGMDFADNNARAVITVGIPFPNIKDVQVKLKKEYNDMHKNTRGLLSGGEWYEIQAFRALNQALGRCLRHRKDWGALILADERFVRDGPRYCKGLSKWMRNKVRPFQGFFTAMDSLSTFTENCIKDMPKVDPNASFIPGTPVIPGHHADPSQSDLSPVTSTPITKRAFDTKKHFSIFTPIKPGKETANQSNQRLQSTNQMECRLISPTEVNGDATLRKASQSQQVLKGPIKGQSSSDPTQPSVPGQGSMLGPAHEQVLKLLNSKLLPQDKPYYVMINEGTPMQQLFLIEPPDSPVNQQDSFNQNVATIVSTPLTKHTSTLPMKTGMKSILLPKRLSEGPSKGVVAVSTQSSCVGSSAGIASTTAQNSSTQCVSSLDHSVEKPLDKSKNESGSESKINNFFKFCKLPEKSFENVVNKSGECSDMSTERPTTPNVFDADTLEDIKDTGIQTDNEDPLHDLCQPDKDDTKLIGTQNSDVKIKSETPVGRKPIFRKKSDMESGTKQENMDGESSDNDFKVKRRSVSGNAITDCQVETSIVDGEDEPLKTRRRGTKRKTQSRSNNLTSKRSKGVDFLDNMDNSKENEPSDQPSLSCASCETVIIPNLKDFEKRLRIPGFLKGISRHKNAAYIYTVVTKPDQFLPVEVNVEGITMNSTWSEETGCCVQYLRCRGCCKTNTRNSDKDIIGARIVSTTQDNQLYSVGQTWLLSNDMKIKEG
ncbi:Fanconi anemia group J protein homolog [Mizuhopecten yessoensis]|uniref:Fanconi anemia group J protein homolog n=1 Tax=Mizuhopecten yessoensis TaxID=6573 RepID=UPI000B4590A3|nr:Fanconi anemia group J protein homolog [Mizuhopecten yessoensis]XP_021366021.1 Fanconi anemia group J protein homolog [Mizuhopecten yessoensis]